MTLFVLAAALWLQRAHVTEIPRALDALAGAHLGWVAAAVVASAVTYLMAALAMIGSVHRWLPFRRALQVQVAAGVTTLAAPAGLGAAGINVWFLERMGATRGEALAAALRNGLAGGVIHLAGLVVVAMKLPVLIAVDAGQVRTVAVRSLLTMGAVSLVVLAAAWWQRERAHRMVDAARQGWRTTLSLLRRRDRAVPLVAGSFGLTIAYGVTLWAGAQAIGVPLDLPTAIAIELVVEALGGLSATPGGIGVVEAATLEGLLLVGANPAAALAVVLLHRLLTFWLPVVPGTVALRQLQSAFAANAELRKPGNQQDGVLLAAA